MKNKILIFIIVILLIGGGLIFLIGDNEKETIDNSEKELNNSDVITEEGDLTPETNNENELDNKKEETTNSNKNESENKKEQTTNSNKNESENKKEQTTNSNKNKSDNKKEDTTNSNENKTDNKKENATYNLSGTFFGKHAQDSMFSQIDITGKNITWGAPGEEIKGTFTIENNKLKATWSDGTSSTLTIVSNKQLKGEEPFSSSGELVVFNKK